MAENLKNPLNTRAYKGNADISPHYLPHSFMSEKYSIGLYCGFDSRKSKWSELSQMERKNALKKDWYIRWSYLNPTTGKMERQKNIYGPANQYGTRKERIQVLNTLKRNLKEILDSGKSPYDDKLTVDTIPSVNDAIAHALEIKKLQMKPESFTRFKSDINKFQSYLFRNGFKNRYITSVNKKTVTAYLNEALKEVSPRSHNNYRTNIGTLWQCMEDEGIVERNIVKSIKLLKSVPKQNRPFTQNDFEMIVGHLGAKDGRMLLVFLFVTYNILRPKEVCRLTVGDFDMEQGLFRVEVKSGHVQTRLIPSILLPYLPDMESSPPEVHLIGRKSVLELWDIKTESKRGKITNSFKKTLNELGYGSEYGLYSGRHYAITKMYRALRKEFAPHQAKSELMLITGHQSMKSLEYYLRNIGVELPRDYSDLLK